MPTVEKRSSPLGRTTTYRYEVGEVTWDGRKIHAFVIGGMPLEGGFVADEHVASIVANRVLAEHPELSAAGWAVFVKTRSYTPVPEWQLIGSGRGRGPLPAGETLSGDIPEDVIQQLEQIFPA
jgi:hypothetical protein